MSKCIAGMCTVYTGFRFGIWKNLYESKSKPKPSPLPSIIPCVRPHMPEFPFLGGVSSQLRQEMPLVLHYGVFKPAGISLVCISTRLKDYYY